MSQRYPPVAVPREWNGGHADHWPPATGAFDGRCAIARSDTPPPSTPPREDAAHAATTSSEPGALPCGPSLSFRLDQFFARRSLRSDASRSPVPPLTIEELLEPLEPFLHGPELPFQALSSAGEVPPTWWSPAPSPGAPAARGWKDGHPVESPRASGSRPSPRPLRDRSLPRRGRDGGSGHRLPVLQFVARDSSTTPASGSLDPHPLAHRSRDIVHGSRSRWRRPHQPTEVTRHG